MNGLIEALAEGPLGTAAEYERSSERGVWSPVRVLIGPEVEPLEVGSVRTVSAVVTLELPVSAVPWSPARGDRVRWAGRTWRVDEPPVLDRLGVAWRLLCHREEA